MAVREYRITIKLDDVYESDLIEKIESLQNSRKIGRFVESALKYIFKRRIDSNDEEFNYLLNNFYTKTTQSQAEVLYSECQGMKSKLDEMYKMCLEMKVLYLLGKKTGLDKKVDNQLLANFIEQSHLSRICELVGCNMRIGVFESERKQNVDKLAEDVVNRAIEVYGEVINEVKKEQVVKQVVVEEKYIKDKVENSRSFIEADSDSEVFETNKLKYNDTEKTKIVGTNDNVSVANISVEEISSDTADLLDSMFG